MQLNFPPSPSVNDTYSFNGKTWVYTGQAWALATTGAINNIVIGNITPNTGNFTTVTASGNVQGAYILGNGAFLTGIAGGGGNANYSNSNVKSYLQSFDGSIIPSANTLYDLGTPSLRWADVYVSNTLSIGGATLVWSGTDFGVDTNFISTGNIQSDASLISQNINLLNDNGNTLILAPSSTGDNYALYFPIQQGSAGQALFNDGAGNLYWDAATGNVTYGDANVAALLNSGTLTSNIITSANTQANFFIGNIRAATGGYDNANVAVLLATYTGNIAAGNFLIPAGVSGNATSLRPSNTSSGIQFVDAVTGQLAAIGGGEANFSGNIQTSGLVLGNIRSATGGYDNSNVITLLGSYVNAISSNNTITTTANIQGDRILGNGAALNLDNFSGNIGSGNASDGIPRFNGSVYAEALYPLANVAFVAIGSQDTPFDRIYTDDGFYANNTTGNFAITVATGYDNVNGVKIQNHTTAQWSNLFVGNVSATTGIVTAGAATVAGNLYLGTSNAGNSDATRYIFGNGYYLTGITSGGSSYGNSNVAGYLPTYNGNLVSLTGALPSLTGNVITVGNVQASYILGNITQAQGYYVYGNAQVASYLQFYSGGLPSLTGNVITTGNITGNYILGNGAFLTGIVSGSNYGNANVAAYLPTYTGAINSLTGNVTTTANVQGAYLIGNISAATGGYSNTNVQNYLPTYTGNLQSNNITVSNNVTISGNLSVIGTTITANSLDITNKIITVAANATSNTLADGAGLMVGSLDPDIANFIYVSQPGNDRWTMYPDLSVQGNVTGTYLLGNGRFLTGLGATYSNADVAAFLPTYTGAINSLTGNVTTTANVQGTYLIGNGASITGIPYSSIVNAYGNTNVQNYLPTYTGNLAQSSDIVALYANAATQSTAIVNLQNLQYSNANVANYLATANTTAQFSNITVTGFANMAEGNVNGFNIGYRSIPQVQWSTNQTLGLADAGKHYYTTTNGIQVNIPANSSVSFPIGTAVMLFNGSVSNCTVVPSVGVTLNLAGNISVSGNRTLTGYAVATLTKVASDTWFIGGSGVQ